nr:uncharacterized protein At4g26485-like isoform X1 [Ipomoea batatas]
MIKEKLVSIFWCCFSGFKKNEEEEAAKGEELEELLQLRENENEEKGEEQQFQAADEMVNKGVILEEGEEEKEEKKQNNKEKGGEEQKADERVNNEGDELEENDDEKQNNEEKGEEQKSVDEMVNEGEEIEEDDDEENGEEQQADEMVNKSKELEEDEEKGEKMVNKLGGVVLGEDDKWIKHYSSSQKILLVGEGDFSFSAALATAFGDASNMVATSLNSHAFLAENYDNAISNTAMMRRKGCKVIHGVDATDMANHPSLKGLKFDRIVFNFPYAGFFKTKSRTSQLLIHQDLMRQFLENAVRMIGEDGEIHITHKTNGFHGEWDIPGLAYQQGLQLVKAEDFELSDYPGYNTKRGFGGDDNFNCYPSKTYMFRLI